MTRDPAVEWKSTSATQLGKANAKAKPITSALRDPREYLTIILRNTRQLGGVDLSTMKNQKAHSTLNRVNQPPTQTE